MGYIRFAHFSAGQVLAVALLLRIYWAFVGNRASQQIFYVPRLERKNTGPRWRYESRNGISFLVKQPRKYVGHNPLGASADVLPLHASARVHDLHGLRALFRRRRRRSAGSTRLFGWVFSIWPNSQDVHTWHHLGMWALVIFSIIHIYAAVREDIVSRQSIISSMISGERSSATTKLRT